MDVWLGFLAAGVLSGVLAGLLGVGGGLVLVPVLLALLPLAGVPAEWLMHTAVGTSLAAIVFTSLSSARAHARRGGVNAAVVWRLAPGLLLGAVLAGSLAAGLRSSVLTVVFAVFALVMAWRIGFAPAAPTPRPEPGTPAWLGFGTLIGVISGLVGIGGGSLTVPLLLRYGRSMTEAVGSSAACGVPIALAGMAGYVWAGWGRVPADGQAGLGQLGFVHLGAAVAITVTAALMAPLGARLAHRWPAARLKRFFALFLLAVALKLLLSVAS